MLCFLSEESQAAHKAAFDGECLRLSLAEQSYALAGKSLRDILRISMRGYDARSVGELYSSVALHRVYFESFCSMRNTPSELVRRAFGSEASMLSEAYKLAMAQRFGFVALVLSRGKLLLSGSENATDIILHGEPLLAIDVSEHVYFRDYSFDKPHYLKAALPHLDLGRVERYF